MALEFYAFTRLRPFGFFTAARAKGGCVDFLMAAIQYDLFNRLADVHVAGPHARLCGRVFSGPGEIIGR